MVPIKNTFQKMIRLVRDLANNMQKNVILKMIGEDTEIDRNMVEALYEPMVHMIRNSIDHGIEAPDIRVAANKDKQGTIVLKAYHRGGNIEIEIQDDGYGLNKQLILDKAISKNLIAKDASLKDSEAFNLIFHPGFSTAAKVTDVSGRGVGMDVVKKAIENLRGHVEISSKQGKGSTFKISLPLTLAIIEGMLVRVGEQRYVVPTNSIIKSFKLEKKNYITIENKKEVVMVMGDLIPLLRINRLFRIKEKTKDQFDGVVVIVMNKNKKKALLLDELLGKDEFVIKNLGETFKGVKGVAGGAILGDGKVGLIMDIASLFDFVENSNI
jgi:two-component system chemotaxis sensor kinase CheA